MTAAIDRNHVLYLLAEAAQIQRTFAKLYGYDLTATGEIANQRAYSLELLVEDVRAGRLETLHGINEQNEADAQAEAERIAQDDFANARSADDEHDSATCRECLGACTCCGDLNHGANDCEAEL